MHICIFLSLFTYFFCSFSLFRAVGCVHSFPNKVLRFFFIYSSYAIFPWIKHSCFVFQNSEDSLLMNLIQLISFFPKKLHHREISLPFFLLFFFQLFRLNLIITSLWVLSTSLQFWRLCRVLSALGWSYTLLFWHRSQLEASPKTLKFLQIMGSFYGCNRP